MINTPLNAALLAQNERSKRLAAEIGEHLKLTPNQIVWLEKRIAMHVVSEEWPAAVELIPQRPLR